MKQLIIGSLPKNFNPKKHVLFNTYSLPAGDKNFNKYEIFSFIERREIDFEELDKRSSLFVKNFIKTNVDKFNNEFDLNQNYIFYKTIMYPWLILVIQSYLEKYMQLKKFQHSYSKQVFVKIICNEDQIGFLETVDIHDSLNSVDFNEWLTSLVIRNTSNEFIIRETKKKFFFNKKAKKLKSFKEFFIDLSRSFLRAQRVYGFSLLEQLVASAILFFNSFKTESKRQDRILSEKKLDIHGLNFIPIEKLFYLTMPKSIKSLKKLPKTTFKKAKRSKFLLGSHIMRVDDKYRLRIANALSRGDKLVGFQHGGGSYGFARHCEEVYENEFSQFRFITWGWQNHSNYKAVFDRLPSPYLTKFKDKYKQNSESVLLATTRMNNVNRYLSPSPTQLEWHRLLYKQLNLMEEMQSYDIEFFYRPHPKKDGAIAALEFFQSNINNLKILKGNFHDRLLGCKCLILDHPGTTLNIAMSANVPTFLFWDKELYPMEKDAEETFEELKSHSIWHDNHIELINFLNNRNISEWWQSQKIQNLRKNFNEKYALTSKKWRREWINYLINL
ncbi:MAG: hypothetical protein ISP94_00250 [SAR86 cluster bacterium]|nr:hypothetical protein [SAR86 cluster bacterium]